MMVTRPAAFSRTSLGGDTVLMLRQRVEQVSQLSERFVLDTEKRSDAPLAAMIWWSASNGRGTGGRARSSTSSGRRAL